MIQRETSIKIPFHDVDPMNLVWHGRYVKYLEIARCELLESFNYSYDEMRISGYAWPIVDIKIKYVKPLTFNQTIKIVSTLVDWEYFLRIDYNIFNHDASECFTKAYTKQVAVDIKNNEMCLACPSILSDQIEKYYNFD